MTELTETLKQQIEDELKLAQDHINRHPVLSFSPGDLKRRGITVSDYLADFTESEAALWKSYYEDEI